ncbi:tRNA pseudouridine(13) synthase TruD [Persephonella sp.]
MDWLQNYIKKKPSDFVVDEVLNIKLEENGEFQIFKLKKSNVSTIQIVRFLSKLFHIKPSEIGFAGLKDKFAVTTQYISIPFHYNIPETVCYIQKAGKWEETKKKPDFERSPAFCLKRLGYTDKEISLGDNSGNLFSIKIYNLTKEKRENFYKNLEIVKKYGFPNYFGEQRFGSVKGRNDFIFLYLLKGKMEKALKIYFSVKGEVRNWGKWELLYRDLKGCLESYEKDLILGLKRGLSFEKAVRILPKNIRLMFNFAFQSFLWNEYLKKYIEKKYPFKRVPFIHSWKLSFYLNIDDLEYLKELNIPYTNTEYKTKDKLLENIIQGTLKEYEIKKEFFGKEIIGIKVLTDGIRKAIVFPEQIKITEKTKKSIRINFFLPAGSYATTFLRAILY